jgi:hypothetical protein
VQARPIKVSTLVIVGTNIFNVYFFNGLLGANLWQNLILGNQAILDTIETAMFVVVLDDYRPVDDSDCCWGLMTGNPENRY